MASSLACQSPPSVPGRDSAAPLASSTSNPRPSASASASAKPRGASLPALQGVWLEQLDLEQGGTAAVCPPLGAREPRPVLVAVHGAGDRPEWACGGWRLAAGGYPFVLCPQGTPVAGNRYAWASSRAVADAVERALRALATRYATHVASVPLIYAGFSQGAMLARPVLLAKPGRFPTAIFAEGGYDTLKDPGFAQAFRAAAGERVMVVCGAPGCFSQASQAKRVLESSGLHVIVAGDAKAGHNLNQRMQVALQAVWPTLVANHAGWQGYRPRASGPPRNDPR